VIIDISSIRSAAIGLGVLERIIIVVSIVLLTDAPGIVFADNDKDESGRKWEEKKKEQKEKWND